MTRDRYDPDRTWVASGWDWSGRLVRSGRSLSAPDARMIAAEWAARSDIARASAVPEGEERWEDGGAE